MIVTMSVLCQSLHAMEQAPVELEEHDTYSSLPPNEVHDGSRRPMVAVQRLRWRAEYLAGLDGHVD